MKQVFVKQVVVKQVVVKQVVVKQVVVKQVVMKQVVVKQVVVKQVPYWTLEIGYQIHEYKKVGVWNITVLPLHDGVIILKQLRI